MIFYLESLNITAPYNRITTKELNMPSNDLKFLLFSKRISNEKNSEKLTLFKNAAELINIMTQDPSLPYYGRTTTLKAFLSQIINHHRSLPKKLERQLESILNLRLEALLKEEKISETTVAEIRKEFREITFNIGTRRNTERGSQNLLEKENLLNSQLNAAQIIITNPFALSNPTIPGTSPYANIFKTNMFSSLVNNSGAEYIFILKKEDKWSTKWHQEFLFQGVKEELKKINSAVTDDIVKEKIKQLEKSGKIIMVAIPELTCVLPTVIIVPTLMHLQTPHSCLVYMWNWASDSDTVILLEKEIRNCLVFNLYQNSPWHDQRKLVSCAIE